MKSALSYIKYFRSTSQSDYLRYDKSQSDTAIIIPATTFWYSFLLTFLMKRMVIKFPSIIAQPIPQPLSLPMQYN